MRRKTGPIAILGDAWGRLIVEGKNYCNEMQVQDLIDSLKMTGGWMSF